MMETPSATHAAPAAVPTTPRYDADVRHGWRAPLLLLGAGLAAWALTQLLSAAPTLAEAVYGPVAPLVALPLSWATGLVPFALAEMLLALYVGWILLLSARALRSVVRCRRRLRNALAGGLRRAAHHGGVLLIAFYALWGLNYARPPVAQQLAWPAFEGVEVDELVALAEVALDATNRAYLDLHGSPDAGAPTALATPAPALDAALDEGWRRAARELGLSRHASRRHGPVKWPVASHGLLRLGVSGIYTPFTAEASVARGQPAIRVPVTMAHEKAHQRGFAREADANFLGYVAAALAPDPHARYAAAAFAHFQLQNALFFRAPDARERLIAARLPGVQRDVEDMIAYYARLHGFAADLNAVLNDRFLSANGIEGGTQDYRRSVWLLVQHARLNDGLLAARHVPPATATP